MDIKTFLNFMGLAEKLKCTTRHSWTTSGRHESVAEHTFRLCMSAWLVKDEFPECDMDKVMTMCLLHDMGEAIKGDVAAFEKSKEHQEEEGTAILQIAELLPEIEKQEFLEVFKELEENKTMEAKIVHALDKMETLIQHNEASVDTWLPLEYDLQLTYGNEQAKVHPYLQKLRDVVKQDSIDKITKEGKTFNTDGYYISKDKKAITVERAETLLRQSEWAKDRKKEDIRKSMENSICYGLFDSKDEIVGFARIITDYTTTFYLMDVIIDERYRGQGLGKMLMDEIMKDVGYLYGILHTDSAQKFYEKYGFVITSTAENGESVMEKHR